MNTLKNRLKRLCSQLNPEKGEMCIIENPIDLLYFTGLPLSAGKLCVHPEKTQLFVDGRYVQMAQERAPVPASLESKESLLSFFQEHSVSAVLFDGQYTSYDVFLKWQALLKDMQIRLTSSPALFSSLRSIKDEQELHKMKASAQLLWKGFEFICSHIETGVTENELAKDFEIFCLQQGAEGLAFESIIAFGPNSAMPHYRSQDVALKPNDIVLIDIGVVLDRYHSDMTRMVFYQKPDPELERLYKINKEAHDAALSLCRPGVAIGKLDRAARDVMARHEVEHLFLHSLGHGIGLQTHEFPRIKWDGADKDVIIEPGMVFTIEPGLYVPGKGGVRYEDTIVITPTGYENLYPNTQGIYR